MTRKKEGGRAAHTETSFGNEGSPAKASATLTRVNQLFIDTVRKTGGNNAKRLLIVAGYTTDTLGPPVPGPVAAH